MNFVYSPPIDGKPFRLNMGLRQLQEANWLEGGLDLADQLKERNKIIVEDRIQVFQEINGHEAGVDFFAKKVIENLIKYHPAYSSNDTTVQNHELGIEVDLEADHPFVQLAKVIAEDLCLLHYENNLWRLVVGVVVFPSRWNLLEKIGKSMDQIHTPVPGYTAQLQPLMTESFNKIKPERPVWRKNWSLHESELLHEPFLKEIPAIIDQFWWRTERQTLTASPDSKYLLFTIRSRSEPLSWLKQDPQAASNFAATLATLPPEMLKYKHLVNTRDQLLDYLKLP